MKILQRPSQNFGDRGQGSSIDKLILHYTGMKSGEDSLARMCGSTSEVSAHYFVDEDGTITQLVDEDKRAWHAGVSYWAGETDINGSSIGIELQNPGHEWGYRDFPEEQIEALAELAADILIRHAIPAKNVLGHSDVAPERKQDPGELFPWQRLATRNIGYWPSANLEENPGPAFDTPNEELRGLLSKRGYNPETSLVDVVTAFQRRYRPANIDGKADSETVQLITACAKIA
ncbi:MAG: N-acetylmuramoyl-L-alanine amidase [Alphaproteobacteria bacterium]|nr:N-acetylmuramoyl-L-alanine amidase [Alphaproteobacteria bacterium]